MNRLNVMKIRKATHTDIPELERLWVEFMDHHRQLDPDYVRSEDASANWVKYTQSRFESDSSIVFVAEDGTDLIGYIGACVRDYPPIFTIEQFGFIEEIVVTEHRRRQGIATRLWFAAEEWLRSRGLSTIRVNINVTNPESQGFFRDLGFADDTQTLLKKY